MAIEQLPGQWSWLENLGTAIGKQRQNQALYQEQQRQQSADRVNTLSQLAQAGVLPPDVLSAQAATDLDRMGIPKQSILDINTNAVTDRKAKQAAAQETARKLQLEMDRVRSQIGYDKARTDALGRPKPPDIKDEIAKRNALENAAFSYWNGNQRNPQKALQLMKNDALFAGAPDNLLLSYINSAAATARAKEAKGAGGPTPTLPGSNPRTDAATSAIGTAVQFLDSAGIPRNMQDEAYKRQVLEVAMQRLAMDPGGQKLIESGLNHADLLSAWDEVRKQAAKESKGAAGSDIMSRAKGLLGEQPTNGQAPGTPTLSDADLWEQKVNEGMTPDQATAYVKSRRKS